MLPVVGCNLRDDADRERRRGIVVVILQVRWRRREVGFRLLKLLLAVR